MLLRYNETIILKKNVREKQSNGSYINTYELIDEFTVQTQTLEDEVSVSIYGDNISKTLRLISSKYKLERFLYPKVNNEEDNISQYYVFLDNVKYKIVSATKFKVDIQRL